MQIPSVVSHFLVAIPRKAAPEMTRGIQNKLNGVRLDKRFRYKRMDSDKDVLHKHASQYPVGLLRTVGEKIYKAQQKPAPYGPMLLSTGVVAPVRQVFEVANQRLLQAPVLKKSVVIPRRDVDLQKAPANLPDVVPSSYAGHSDNHAEARTRFMRQIKHARRELLTKNKSSLAEMMGRKGTALREAVLRCDKEYERQYSLEFGAFFFQRIGKEAPVAEGLKRTLREAHAYAANKALLHISLSEDPDMKSYEGFLSRFEVRYVKVPSIPPRTGAVAYKTNVPPQTSTGEAG